MTKCPCCGSTNSNLKWVQTLKGEEQICMRCIKWFIGLRRELILKGQ